MPLASSFYLPQVLARDADAFLIVVRLFGSVAKPARDADAFLIVVRLSGSVAKPTGSVARCLNIGLLTSQIATRIHYAHWERTNLRRDVQIMIKDYDVDVVCLCEICDII